MKKLPMLRVLKNNDLQHLKYEMEQCQVDPSGIDIMLPKSKSIVLKTSPLPAAGCNILKQQMLSIGGEVAISKGCANCSVAQTPAIIMGTDKQLRQLVLSLYGQGFGLLKLKEELQEFLDNQEIRVFKIAGKTYNLSRKTLIMGILNVTPDSFSDGGKYPGEEKALEHALKMIEDGADIIDIGGESTRPGAEKIDLKTEINRVIPVIEKIRQKSDIPISIDTYKSQVALEALAAGADIVNDISGLNFDTQMAEVITQAGASAVLMHIQGTPESMQKNPTYQNMIDEILVYLSHAAQKLIDLGLEKHKIALDPGIGFGKPWKDNFELIRYLEEFKSSGFPVLVGPSRKSFIGNLLDLPADQRLAGTLASVACSVQNGADIIRVHDVKECCQAIKVADLIAGKGQNGII